MNNNYQELFSFIEKILNKQKQQKFRGINDYNMVSVVRSPFHEVGMHSNVIYSLIDPTGFHYQGRLFLDLFIQHVLKLDLALFSNNIIVQTEESTSDKRRIDFTIKSETYSVGIEMKINAKDSNKQIFDYYNYLFEESKRNNIVKPAIYYLSKFGEAAGSKSVQNVDVKNISFANDIIDWLKLCQREVRNITNLNIAIQNYMDIVRKITGKFKGNIMSIEDELLKDKQHLNTVLTLIENSKKIKGNILFTFFESVRKRFDELNKFKLIEVQPSHKEFNQVDRKNCDKWFREPKVIHCIGLFFDCDLGGDLYLHIEAASKHLHIGIVKCQLDKGALKWVNMDETDLANTDRSLIRRKGWRVPQWYSVDKGNIFSMNPETDIVKTLINFSDSKLEQNILDLIKSSKPSD
ncbi:MAG: hypothetical protein COB83_13075 [Gammaproteobacteria bacterium]|nr:MAG: hypothetical protein COB83_13075 [Gammaproteobacteria bacterium]